MPANSYPIANTALGNEGLALINVTESLRTLFQTAGMPLGPMTQLGTVAAAVAEALSGVSGGQQFVDVRQFGNWADGVNCTATLIAALNAAGTNTVAGTPYPLGVQMPTLPDPKGGVLLSAAINAGPIQIPTGVSLKGAGWKTHLTVDPSTMIVANANYHIFDCIGSGGQNVISDFQLDGNKANIGSGIGQVGNIGFYIDSNTGAINDVVIERVFCHDLYNTTGGESFGFFVGSTSAGIGSRVTFNSCWSWNHMGSGFSTSGPNGVAPQNSTTEVIFGFCRAYSNNFQGFTAFQAQHAQFIGCTSIGNQRCGYNNEQSDNIQYTACVARLNNFEGYRVLGRNSNIHYDNCRSYQNAQAGFGQTGEFSALQGSSRNDAPISVYIKNCDAQPTSTTGCHFFSSQNSGATTLGPSAATADEALTPFQGIYISGPDIDKWTYYVDGSVQNNKYAPLGMYLRPGSSGGAVNVGGHPSSWTLTNITVSAAPSGSLGPNAKTFTQTAANSTSSAVATTALAAMSRYKVGYRIKVIDKNATWELSTPAQIKQVQFPQQTNDLGVWFQGEFIITTGASATSLQLITTANTATASAIGVDFISVERLPYLGSISGS